MNFRFSIFDFRFKSSPARRGVPTPGRAIVGPALFSIGVHALLLVPIGLAGIKESARADVVRGVSSIELEFSAPQSVPPDQGEELSLPLTKPKEPLTSDDGALSEQQSLPFQNPAPRYPWVARANGWEGTVLLRARVGPRGQATSVQVAHSSGFSVLDGAALAALKQWKFLPARKQSGQAVASSVEIPITFILETRDKRQGE